MSYERINWEDEPSTNTPISAENLNKMDVGIEQAHEELERLGSAVADLLYEPITINSFTNTVNIAELGSTVTDVLLSWTTNKAPTSLSLDGEELDAEQTSLELTGQNITANKSWTLRAVDERETAVQRSTGIVFYNGVYYGAVASPDILTDDFILGFAKVLTNTRKRTFTANAGEGQYIWYCLPADLGQCTFKVGGFEGGFDLIDTIDLTNASGHTAPYYIYRSGNPSLGSTTVEVS